MTDRGSGSHKHKYLHYWKRWMLLLYIGLWLSACRTPADHSLPLHISAYKGETPAQAWQQPDSLYIANGLFNPGISPQTWWLKTTVENRTNRGGRHFLLLNNPHINRMEVYFDGATEPAYRMGDQYPFEQRPYSDRDLVIPLYLNEKDNINVLIHLDKKGETLQVKAEALDEMAFDQRRGTDQMLMGAFTGWMAIVFLFALFIWWELRQASALLYALFTATLVVWLNAHWGIAFQYWWPHGTWWVGKARPLFNLVANVLIILIILKLFVPRRSDRWIKVSLYGLMGIHVAVIISTIAISEYVVHIQAKMTFLFFTIMASLAMSTLLLVYLVRQWMARVPYAGFFLLGIAFVFVWNILMQLDQGGLPVGFTHVMYNYGTTLSHVGETALFTLGFAKIAAGYKKEKDALTISLLQKEKEAAEAIIAMQEAERQRIGRDLHDSIGGMLGSIYMQADILSRQHPDVPLDTLKDLTTKSIQEARTLSHDLAPPHLDEWGLNKVLENQVQLIRTQRSVDLGFYYETRDPLTSSAKLVVYRICNELLSNMVKHSGATEGMLEILQEEDGLQILVEDNGKGMDIENVQTGLGLKSIRERVGYLHGVMHIDANQQGTTIIIHLPNVFTKEA
ncbi:MAG TPA: 7TM diverse intracellular signaling domain-containing protein [Phnomibacter sp.]|nr:7TM diverse intracellular signaling domain-containing protein [Phnomibacter sp.]